MSPPNGPDQNAVVAEELANGLIAVIGRLQRRIRPSYHRTMLSPVRLSVLSFIVSKGTTTGGQIAQWEQVTPATITRVLDGLQDSGFIVKRPSQRDRRMVEIEATDEGRDALAETRAWQVERLAGSLSGLDEAGLDRLASALDVLAKLDESQKT